MTLGGAVLLLVLALVGLLVLPRVLPQKPRLRRGLQAVCGVAALLSAVYSLLTLLLVWAAGQKF